MVIVIDCTAITQLVNLETVELVIGIDFLVARYQVFLPFAIIWHLQVDITRPVTQLVAILNIVTVVVTFI